MDAAVHRTERGSWPLVNVKHLEVKQVIQGLWAIYVNTVYRNRDVEVARARLQRINIEGGAYVAELALVRRAFVGVFENDQGLCGVKYSLGGLGGNHRERERCRSCRLLNQCLHCICSLKVTAVRKRRVRQLCLSRQRT